MITTAESIRRRSPLPAELRPEAVTAVIDTREQLPLELSPLRIVRGILPRHGGRIVAVDLGERFGYQAVIDAI
jgi:hypothetical protein